MRITFGFSTCPNDTFMFDALVHKKIDTEGIDFDVKLADIEKLNKWSLQARLDITKVSYGAFLLCNDKYIIIDSGSALGNNCGPILVKNKNTVFDKRSSIAIPGKNTTANMLCSFFYPENVNKKVVLFSDIESYIISGKVDAGLLIHENRFTYQKKGLEKIKDLGECWQEKTKSPIPLGGIVVKRKLEKQIQHKIQRVIKRSINYAFNNPLSSKEYVKSYAQEIDDLIIEKHIDLYVNKFSLSLGKEGKKSIIKMLEGYNLTSKNMFL